MNNVATIPPWARRENSWNVLANVTGGITPVSTLTTLLNWTSYGNVYDTLIAMLENTDGANQVSLILDVSNFGNYPNLNQRIVWPANAQNECSCPIVTPNPFTYIRVSAQTLGPSYPTVNINWSLFGFRRY